MKLRNQQEPRVRRLLRAAEVGAGEREMTEERFNPLRHHHLTASKELMAEELAKKKRGEPIDSSLWPAFLNVASVDAVWVEQLRKDEDVQQTMLEYARGLKLDAQQPGNALEFFRALAKLAQTVPGIRTDPMISQNIRAYYEAEVKKWNHLLGERGPRAETVSLPNLAAAMMLFPDQQSMIKQEFLDKGQKRALFLIDSYLPDRIIKALLVAADALMIDPDLRPEILERFLPYWKEIRLDLREGSSVRSFLAVSFVAAEQAVVDENGNLQFQYSKKEKLAKVAALPDRPQL